MGVMVNKNRETYDSDEEPDIRFCETVADEVVCTVEDALETI